MQRVWSKQERESGTRNTDQQLGMRKTDQELGMRNAS